MQADGCMQARGPSGLTRTSCRLHRRTVGSRRHPKARISRERSSCVRRDRTQDSERVRAVRGATSPNGSGNSAVTRLIAHRSQPDRSSVDTPMGPRSADFLPLPSNLLGLLPQEISTLLRQRDTSWWNQCLARPPRICDSCERVSGLLRVISCVLRCVGQFDRSIIAQLRAAW